MTETEAQLYPVRSLAYLGDAVLEIMVRKHLIISQQGTYGEHPSEKALDYVTAKAQSAAADLMIPNFTATENDVFHRGRNSTHANVPKHATAAEYRKATALECVFGYLYLSEQYERLDDLFRLGYLKQDEL